MKTIIRIQQTVANTDDSCRPELCPSDAETHKYSHYPSRD
jgi:hypothetical protein